jgi:hypothetical protein
MQPGLFTHFRKSLMPQQMRSPSERTPQKINFVLLGFGSVARTLSRVRNL